MNWTAEEVDWIDKAISRNRFTSDSVETANQFGPDRANQLLTIAGLQERARRKFGPGVWMASQKAVEQASDRAVAKYKASLIQQHHWCWTCGSGSVCDAIELAQQRQLIAVDADPQVARICIGICIPQEQRAPRWFVMMPMSYAERLKGDWDKLVVHIDPDRRPGTGERVSAPELYSPSLENIQQLFTDTGGCSLSLPQPHRCQKPLLSGYIVSGSVSTARSRADADQSIFGNTAVAQHRFAISRSRLSQWAGGKIPSGKRPGS